MKDPDFLEEVVMRVESAYEADEVVAMMELSLQEIAEAFPQQFTDLAFNLGFINEQRSDDDEHDDEYNW